MSPHQPRPIRGLILALLAVSAVFLTACGDDGRASGAPADATGGPVEIDIADFSYDPATITVSPGQAITFTNDDETAHTATAKDGSFNTDTVEPGTTASVTAPDQPGAYPFICSFHPFMKGTVVVR